WPGSQRVGSGGRPCIGTSGPPEPHLEDAVVKNDLVTASVLSGNRNFEARVHQSVKANFLASPPLVVAFAIAGRIDIDLVHEPIGKGKDGKDVYLRDIWPTSEEVNDLVDRALDPEAYRRLYRDFSTASSHWEKISAPTGVAYEWDDGSTYIRRPPYFEGFTLDGTTGAAPATKDIRGARPLALFGDSITTDHISPAGAIKASSPAGKYLVEHRVAPADLNSYGARRRKPRGMVGGPLRHRRHQNLLGAGRRGGRTLPH